MSFIGQGLPYYVINVVCNVMALPGHEATHSVAYTLKDGRTMMKPERETGVNEI